ncbi:MAG: FMN-dependent NADH-azoreductase [Labilithrix sp.]|nr:FMN-dependent NADH-azoreductase [Labilithrix sp.]
MSTLLRIDASARAERSQTRQMTRTFVDTWLDCRPTDTVIERNLAKDPPEFVTEPWIASAFTEPARRTPEQRRLLEASDRLIGELEQADVIVLGTPMYNYGMPAALKAWFDQVIRVGRTFSFDLARGDWPLAPILTGKTLVVLSSRGEFAFAPGGVRAHMNHLDPHIATCAHYLGVSESHLVSIEYQEFGGERHERSIASAFQSVVELAERLARESSRSPRV